MPERETESTLGAHSPQPESTWKEHAVQLQETLQQVESHVAYLESDQVHSHVELEATITMHKAEVEEIKKRYEEDLERYCDCIDNLEEEVQYTTAILDIQMDDMEQLDGLTNTQRKEIEDLISLHIQDEMERFQANAIIRDKIVDLMDHTLL
ncbi:uncharacterized protein BJ212DRAFT_1480151 [Suillus subaureus]|uniref:Uncharacterized protein n=1 Tax=Suillus subaureus TaxID=48587 RepID=A0A9P7ECS4_9AGAM|nr:uncharacterized protein BJ212DRAFT_1480151 [Suillus subaureus]KAG1817586.1 hypothetical protein BJ212DRAFT_1480151 [Suillus subaureus]